MGKVPTGRLYKKLRDLTRERYDLVLKDIQDIGFRKNR